MEFQLIHVGYAIGAVIAAYVLGEIALFVLNHIHKFTSKTQTKLDDALIESVKRPVRFAALILGLYIAAIILKEYYADYWSYISKAFLAITLLLIAVTISRLAKSFFGWYIETIAAKTQSKSDDTVFRFLQKFISIAIYLIMLLVILDEFGIKIGPLLAGLGIAGIAVALALQDTLSNLFAAIYITADKPVRVGDFIEIDNGIKGTVLEIGWRSTRIKLRTNNVVIIPNSKLSQSIITNYDLPEAEQSLVLQYGVSYSSDLDKVEKVTVDVARSVMKKFRPEFKDFVPSVRFHTFGDSSINFSVQLWIKLYEDKYIMTHEFNKALHKAFAKNRIEIPFPQRVVHLRKK